MSSLTPPSEPSAPAHSPSTVATHRFLQAQHCTPHPVPFIDLDDLHWAIYERIAEIQDPEFNQTLEELEVLASSSLTLALLPASPVSPPPNLAHIADCTASTTTGETEAATRTSPTAPAPKPTTTPLEIRVVFKPTVPHCSYASLIGLCIVYTVNMVLQDFNYTPPPPTAFKATPRLTKMTVLLEPGSHQQEAELNKQFNDKERLSAAFDNPTLLHQVQKLCTARSTHQH